MGGTYGADSKSSNRGLELLLRRDRAEDQDISLSWEDPTNVHSATAMRELSVATRHLAPVLHHDPEDMAAI